MYSVGLTGNITSGKSTAISCFKGLGIPVIIADEVAREVTAPGHPALQLIKNYFGNQIITAQGLLDRAELRKVIFSNAEHRIWLENLLHPLIRKAIENKITELKGHYCVIEIPLLLCREDYPYLNRILAILANPQQLVERVMARDQHSRAEAIAILSVQPDEAARRAVADDIIINNGTIAQLENAIIKIHEQYLLFSKKTR